MTDGPIGGPRGGPPVPRRACGRYLPDHGAVVAPHRPAGAPASDPAERIGRPPHWREAEGTLLNIQDWLRGIGLGQDVEQYVKDVADELHPRLTTAGPEGLDTPDLRGARALVATLRAGEGAASAPPRRAGRVCG